MLSTRHEWLERLASWGTALAVPVVGIIGFGVLVVARDVPKDEPAAKAPPRAAAAPTDCVRPRRSVDAPAACPERAAAPSPPHATYDAPPVIELHPAGTSAR